MTPLILFIVFGIPVISGALIIVTMLLKKNSNESGSEESQLMQELYQGLNRMEQRIEALETLVLDTSQSAQTQTSGFPPKDNS